MTALPRTSAPAERALVAVGYDTLQSLAGVSVADLMPLHGFGPLAVERIRAALAAAGLPALVRPARELAPPSAGVRSPRTSRESRA